MIRKLIALTFAALLWACAEPTAAPELPPLSVEQSATPGCDDKENPDAGAYCLSHPEAVDWVLEHDVQDCEIVPLYQGVYSHEIRCPIDESEEG